MLSAVKPGKVFGPVAPGKEGLFFARKAIDEITIGSAANALDL
jgi:hypothetical protein